MTNRNFCPCFQLRINQRKSNMLPNQSHNIPHFQFDLSPASPCQQHPISIPEAFPFFHYKIPLLLPCLPLNLCQMLVMEADCLAIRKIWINSLCLFSIGWSLLVSTKYIPPMVGGSGGESYHKSHGNMWVWIILFEGRGEKIDGEQYVICQFTLWITKNCFCPLHVQNPT